MVILTACSRWERANSMFFVCVRRILPSCKWVRASTRGGGLKLKTACKHCMQDFMFGGLDVRKFSAKPSNERYQASCDDAILTFLWCSGCMNARKRDRRSNLFCVSLTRRGADALVRATRCCVRVYFFFFFSLANNIPVLILARSFPFTMESLSVGKILGRRIFYYASFLRPGYFVFVHLQIYSCIPAETPITLYCVIFVCYLRGLQGCQRLLSGARSFSGSFSFSQQNCLCVFNDFRRTNVSLLLFVIRTIAHRSSSRSIGKTNKTRILTKIV